MKHMWYGITLIVGIIFLLYAIGSLRGALTLLRIGKRTTATVFKLEQESNNDGGATYRPFFKFKTDKNQEVIYRHTTSSYSSAWDIGDKVQIIYKPDNLEEVRLLTYFGTFSTPLILFSISFPLMIIGGGYYLAQLFLK